MAEPVVSEQTAAGAQQSGQQPGQHPAPTDASSPPTVLGIIVGKSMTREFSFAVQAETKVFEYLKVFHRVFGDVLCQVLEITATLDDRIALCNIIGYRDPDGTIKSIRIPFDVGSRVLRADDDFIRQIIRLGDEHGALLGKLEGRSVPVHLDLRKILTKHVAVLAKSGAGKSYCVGVMIEEILEKRVPIVIIDPHGEYATLSQASTVKDDIAKLAWFRMTPKSYAVNEYGDTATTGAKPLKLSNKMSQQELVQMIPTKLTGAQIGILYSALRNIDQVSLDSVIASLNAEESNAKWGLINILEHLRTYNIFSNDPTPYDDVVAPGVCSIINLRGIPAEIQSIIVYKLIKDLFEMRKRGTLPPFFLVLEEAHNFCPERSFGETTASKTIRTIASEGRKFGLGLCVVSQRPARIDKSVVSQCSTQIILKVTNPNDLKAISSSVEGLTAEAEKEIANLPIGTALVTGIVEVPLLINVRPRRTQHGGHSVDIFQEIDEADKRPRPVRPIPQPIPPPTPAVSVSLAAAPSPSATPQPSVERNIGAPGIPSRPVSPRQAVPTGSDVPSAASPTESSMQPRAVKPESRRKKEDVAAQAQSPRVDMPLARADAPADAAPAKTQQPVAPQAPVVSTQPLAAEPQYTTAAKRPPPPQPIAVLRPKRGILEQLSKEKPLTSVEQQLIPAFLMACQQGQEQFRLIVERIEGRIVTSIDRFTTKRIPDLKHLSRDELKFLQDAYTKGKLAPTKEEQQSSALQTLVQKGYLLQQPDGTLALSEAYLFQKLSKVKSDDDLEMTRVTDATMLEPALNEMQVRMELSPFVAVKGAQECWILRINVK